MAVYRIQITKHIHGHHWSNSYAVLTSAAYSRMELDQIADTIAPRLVDFERHFHSEEVELRDTLTAPLLDPPITDVAYRPAIWDGRTGGSAMGLRPLAIEDSSGPAITLMLGLQPLAGHWGTKDYRYALRQTEIRASSDGFHLRADSQEAWQQILTSAKQHIQPLLRADMQVPSLAVSASRNAHDPAEYYVRLVRDVTLKGVHISKHRR